MLREGFIAINYGKDTRIALYELVDHSWEYSILKKDSNNWSSNIGIGKGKSPGECLDAAIAVCLKHNY